MVKGDDWNQPSRLIKKNISELIKPEFEPLTSRSRPTSSRTAFTADLKPPTLKFDSTSKFRSSKASRAVGKIGAAQNRNQAYPITPRRMTRGPMWSS